MCGGLMKNSNSIKIGIAAIISITFALLFQNCAVQNLSNKASKQINTADKQNALNSMKTVDEIIRPSISDQQFCNVDLDCKSIEYGYRGCGGPEEYLIYSTAQINATDEKKLLNLISEYNSYSEIVMKAQKNIVGICSIVMKPNLSCINQQCKTSPMIDPIPE
jgi:hypothetical protein